ncbi:hypothetical protein U1Q18_024665 [Sarracenia purpurea var. burkii]
MKARTAQGRDTDGGTNGAVERRRRAVAVARWCRAVERRRHAVVLACGVAQGVQRRRDTGRWCCELHEKRRGEDETRPMARRAKPDQPLIRLVKPSARW